MKCLSMLGAVLVTASAAANANPWDVTPATAPYKAAAQTVKQATPPGQPSNLNPSCAGMTGEQCAKAAQALNNQRPVQAEAENVPLKKPKK